MYIVYMDTFSFVIYVHIYKTAYTEISLQLYIYDIYVYMYVYVLSVKKTATLQTEGKSCLGIFTT